MSQIKRVSVLLKEFIEDKNTSTYQLEKKAGLSRRYIRNIIEEVPTKSGKIELGSKETIEKLMEALELNKKERLLFWASWLYQKGFYEIVEELIK